MQRGYEYKAESLLVFGGRVRAQFRYPVGGSFGIFYAELAEGCRKWLVGKYAEYSGRGISFHFFADILFSDGGLTSVSLRVSIFERGRGKTRERCSAQNWLGDGRILPPSVMLGKKMQKTAKNGQTEWCIVGGEVFSLGKTGEKNSIGVKIGNLSQEILPRNLKNG